MTPEMSCKLVDIYLQTKGTTFFDKIFTYNLKYDTFYIVSRRNAQPLLCKIFIVISLYTVQDKYTFSFSVTINRDTIQR